MQTFKKNDPWPGVPRKYQKKVFTEFVRIAGPFTVETSEGPLTCQDGYLGKDARGYYYPVARDEFELIYELAPHYSHIDDEQGPPSTMVEV